MGPSLFPPTLSLESDPFPLLPVTLPRRSRSLVKSFPEGASRDEYPSLLPRVSSTLNGVLCVESHPLQSRTEGLYGSQD